MKRSDIKPGHTGLRQTAEELLGKKFSEPVLQPSEYDALKLIHELQIIQIELKIQNEELRNRNDELRESEARFKLVADSAPVLIWKSGTDALCDYFNQPWLDFTGRTMDQETGNGWAEGVHPDDLQGYLDKYLGAFSAQEPFTMEYRLHRNDGEYRWLLDHGVPRFTPDGKFAGYIGSCVDVTGNKETCAQLIIMGDLLQEAQEIADIGSFSYDVVHDQHYNSPQMDKIFGYAPDQEKNARAWSELLYPDDRQAMEAFAAECIEHGVPYDRDYRIIRDGQIRWIRCICKAEKDPGGRVVRFSGVNIDITDRKHALMLLEQTRHNYETFFNTIDEFLFVLDGQGNIIHTNSTVINRLGYTREELSGQSVLMIHPPERREEAGRIVGEMLSGLTAFCPVPVIAKSGVRIPVETRVSQGFWDGKPAIFGVTKDISKLMLSEEKFSKLFHLNPSACGISDLDNHTYLEVNQAFCNLFGFDKDEVIGKTAFSLGIMTSETANSVLSTADGNGRISNAGASLIAKNGEIRNVLMSAENFYIQEKKYRFTVAQDITRQKQAQKQLEEISARLALATLAGGVGIWDFDVVNNILIWDDQMYSLYGVQNSNSAGEYATWRKGLHTEDMERGDMEIQAALCGEKEFNTEFRVEWPDGTVRNIRALAVVQRNGEGKPLRMIGTNWDITSQKQIEQELRESREDLQRINAEKNRFFSIIAHDLRGPFNGFLGLTQMMVEDLSDLSQAELEKIALSMRNSALNLFRLLENLLEWARLKQDLITLTCEEVQLLPAVNESVAVVLGTAITKGINITISVPESLVVFADRNVLQTVIRNLVSNAIKFTPKGGSVGISARIMGDDSVEVSIKDTGIGMSRTMVQQLFQLDAHTGRRGTEGEPSTGLGLIICSDFIEKSGGRLWVKSDEGAGSTFYFTLPKTN